MEPHIPAFAEFARWKGKWVLEMGCGIGTDTMNFARAGAFVTAVDLSSRSLEVATQRAEVLGLSDRIRFYHVDGENLSLVVPPREYDLIYSFGVVHHTPNPEAMIAEFRRFAKTGGTLKLMVYHRYSWKVLWVLLGYGKGRFWKLPQLVAKYSEAQTGCPVTYTYSRTEARSLIEPYGFRKRSVQIAHIFPYRVADYVQYRYVKAWYFRRMPDRLVHALEKRFGGHLLLTAEAV